MILAFLLSAALSTDIGQSRSLVVPHTIAGTLCELGAGLVATLGSERLLDGAVATLEGRPEIPVYNPRLYVDGVRDGTPARRIGRSLWRIMLFLLDVDSQGRSVELRYEIAYRGLWIHRAVYVRDNLVMSRTWANCALGPDGRLKYFEFTMRAVETSRGAHIRLGTWIRANTGICPQRSRSRLPIVNRIAGRHIAASLAGVLRTVEVEGRQIARRGDVKLTNLHQSFVGRLINIR